MQADESLLTEIFMQEIAKGEGHLFDANTIFFKIKEVIPAARLSNLVTRRMGVQFRRFSRLKLIYQTGKAVPSQREGHDGNIVLQWAVGNKAALPTVNK